MPNGSDIIIRGGSSEVEFNPAEYLSDPSDPKIHKNKNAAKKITQVVVKIDGAIKFDTGDVPSGLKCEIRAFVK